MTAAADRDAASVGGVHSPGPWRYFRTPAWVSGWSIATANGIVARAPGQEADARLIAAAPSMAAELDRLHNQIAAYVNGEYVDWSDNLIRIGDVLGTAGVRLGSARPC